VRETTAWDVMNAIRAGHVEQAKGHLRAASATYYGDTANWEVVNAKIEEFIAWLENEAPGIA
jgi:hypothetical protein